MAFELQVSFTGLCLFLIRDDCERVAVVQPDCRLGHLTPVHPDGDPVPGEHHVSYLRYDLASLVPGLPAGDTFDGPIYEGVHRFSREALYFGLPHLETQMTINTQLPAMERIAPGATNSPTLPTSECGNGDVSLLKPIDGLFGTDPELKLVMRTIFSGGTLSGGKRSTFEFPTAFNPGAASKYQGSFARTVTWTRPVSDADELTLTIASFDGSTSQQITLHPVPDLGGKQVISLNIGNLCADNPLEWPEFSTPVASTEDRDFKWLYRLLETLDGKGAETLLSGGQFPVPTRPSTSSAGAENCIGTRITVGGF